MLTLVDRGADAHEFFGFIGFTSFIARKPG